MRKINSILTAIIIILFILHMIYGGLVFIGVIHGGGVLMHSISGMLITLAAVHAVIGIKLTFDTLRTIKKAGVYYGKENRLFWIRRLSGAAIIMVLPVHLASISAETVNGKVILPEFTPFFLICSLILILSVFIHICTNVNPLRIALGLADEKSVRTEVILVLCALLVLGAFSFVLYYMRWQYA